MNIDVLRTWNHTSAYLVGYFYADASIREEKALALHCQATDAYLIEEIKNILGSHHKIRYLEEQINPKNGSVSKPSVQLEICSKELAVLLRDNFNLQAAKSTKDLPFPAVPSMNLPSFCLGYLDGDGCTSLNNRDVLNVSFLGSLQFIEGLQDQIASVVSVPKLGIYRSGSVWNITWSSKADTYKIAMWLLTHPEPFGLMRKKQKLINLVSNAPATNVSLSKDSSTGYLGVSKVKGRERWAVEVCAQRRRLRLNTFVSIYEAAYAYNCGVLLLQGSRARLNILPADGVSDLDDYVKGKIQNFVQVKYEQLIVGETGC